MKLIPLTQGKFAQVDDEDYDHLMQWKWYAAKSNQVFYAQRMLNAGKGKQKIIKMHRFLLGECESMFVIDHKDRDGLNNQRYNLRQSTEAQNSYNTSSRINSTSKYLGVSINKWVKRYKPKGCATIYYPPMWTAVITPKRVQRKLGNFPLTPCGELLAAIKYDVAAEKEYGEFANLNFK